jgi:uncharacterized membrane protein
VLSSWTHELKLCTTLGAGLCLNQFLIFLFISHKLVSEQFLGANKFKSISNFFSRILIKAVDDLNMVANALGNKGMSSKVGPMN